LPAVTLNIYKIGFRGGYVKVRYTCRWSVPRALPPLKGRGMEAKKKITPLTTTVEAQPTRTHTHTHTGTWTGMYMKFYTLAINAFTFTQINNTHIYPHFRRPLLRLLSYLKPRHWQK
jgi:hypothetical protein